MSEYNQNRMNAAVLYLRKRRLSYNQIALVLYANNKTVYEKVKRAEKHGTFKNFDNRTLPRRAREHLAQVFKRMSGYWSRIWDFIYCVVDTIEEAFNYTGKQLPQDDDEDIEDQEDEPP